MLKLAFVQLWGLSVVKFQLNLMLFTGLIALKTQNEPNWALNQKKVVVSSR